MPVREERDADETRCGRNGARREKKPTTVGYRFSEKGKKKKKEEERGYGERETHREREEEDSP